MKALSDYGTLIGAAVDENVDMIVSGAGLVRFVLMGFLLLML